MPVGAQTRCQISKLETNFQVDRPESTVVHYLMRKMKSKERDPDYKETERNRSEKNWAKQTKDF